MRDFIYGISTCILNIYILIRLFCRWDKRETIIQVNSFVVPDDQLNNIEIIDCSGVVNSDNLVNDLVNDLVNYLKHHILYSDTTFTEHQFDRILSVRFKYQNEIYTICLNGLHSKKTEQTNVVKEPRILSAIIEGEVRNEGEVKSEGEVKNEETNIDVTEEIVELHGPTRNFFKHIPDAIFDPAHILTKYNGFRLRVFDMLGREYVYEPLS